MDLTCVDTCFLVDLMRGDTGALGVARSWQEEGWTLHVPAPAYYELQRGLAMVRWPPDELRRIRQVLEGTVLLDLDRESMRIGGQVDGALQRQGLKVEPEDCMVAGIALRHGLPVITRNTEHFGRVTGLDVQSY